MKIDRTSGAGPSAPSRGTRTTAGAGFSVPTGQTSSAAPAAKAAASAALGGIDALLALQSEETLPERRRRMVSRAGRILDTLDQLKLGMLDGRLDREALGRLGVAVREQRAATEDTGLEGLLDQIETRAAVELAKAEAARAA